MSASNPILLVGAGNALLSDDGIGVHVVRELQKSPVPGVAMVEMGTAILHGLSFLELAARVLVIDAARGGQRPGTIYLFNADEPPALAGPCSIHAMGLREALRWLPPGLRTPPLTVLGVEPETLEYGMSLSPCLQAALPRVAALARQTLSDWLMPARLPETAAHAA